MRGDSVRARYVREIALTGCVFDYDAAVVRFPNDSPLKMRRATYMRYWTFTWGPANRRVPIPVHVVIAYLKFGDALFKPGVVTRHRDNDSGNNAWDNIVLGTHHDNQMDRPPEVRVAHAKKAARAQRRLTDAQVRALRRDREQGATYKALCRKYSVVKSTVSDIVTGRLYRDVV